VCVLNGGYVREWNAWDFQTVIMNGVSVDKLWCPAKVRGEDYPVE